MPLPASGEIKLIADIEAEFDQTGTTDISLFQARDDAGLSAGEVQMTDFYGLSASTAPSVTTNALTSLTTTSMQANGNVTSDGGASITERGFYFGTNSSSATSNTKYTVSGTTGSFTRSFTGLSNSTVYYCWAFATNSAGTTIGSRVNATTLTPYTPSIVNQNSAYGNPYVQSSTETAGTFYNQYLNPQTSSYVTYYSRSWANNNQSDISISNVRAFLNTTTRNYISWDSNWFGSHYIRLATGNSGGVTESSGGVSSNYTIASQTNVTNFKNINQNLTNNNVTYYALCYITD